MPLLSDKPNMTTTSHHRPVSQRIGLAVVVTIFALGLAFVWLGSAWLVFRAIGWL